jgi:hypothetical protein
MSTVSTSSTEGASPMSTAVHPLDAPSGMEESIAVAISSGDFRAAVVDDRVFLGEEQARLVSARLLELADQQAAANADKA